MFALFQMTDAPGQPWEELPRPAGARAQLRSGRPRGGQPCPGLHDAAAPETNGATGRKVRSLRACSIQDGGKRQEGSARGYMWILVFSLSCGESGRGRRGGNPPEGTLPTELLMRSRRSPSPAPNAVLAAGRPGSRPLTLWVPAARRPRPSAR